MENGYSVQYSCSAVSNSLWSHGLKHPRLPCPSPAPEACSNSSPLSRWCHPTISSSVNSFSSCLQSFPASVSFPISQFFTSGGQTISFSISINPSNEYSGLISFRVDWFDLLAVQGTLKSLLQHHSSKASILRRSAFFMTHHSYLHMTTEKTIPLSIQIFIYVLCIFVYAHTYIHIITYGKITQISASLKFCIVWRCFCFSLCFLLSTLTPALEIPSSLAHS